MTMPKKNPQAYAKAASGKKPPKPTVKRVTPYRAATKKR
jgi:hypothetical protein